MEPRLCYCIRHGKLAVLSAAEKVRVSIGPDSGGASRRRSLRGRGGSKTPRMYQELRADRPECCREGACVYGTRLRWRSPMMRSKSLRRKQDANDIRRNADSPECCNRPISAGRGSRMDFVFRSLLRPQCCPRKNTPLCRWNAIGCCSPRAPKRGRRWLIPPASLSGGRGGAGTSHRASARPERQATALESPRSCASD